MSMFEFKYFLYKVCGIPSNSDVSVIDSSDNPVCYRACKVRAKGEERQAKHI